MDSRPVHYLESLDSVRSAASRKHPHRVTKDQGDASAQVMMEALIALAMGRDIVLPLSFALDSYACQHLVRTIAAAQHAMAPSEDFWDGQALPLRLHLYGVDSLAGAVSNVFNRVAAQGTDTFVTSLYPDLAGKNAAKTIGARARKIAKGKSSPSNPLEGNVPGYRDDLFKATWDYFRAARAGDERMVVEAKPVAGPKLSQRISAIADAHRGNDSSDVATAVATSLRRLREASHHARPRPDGSEDEQNPFRNRSLLRSKEPWERESGKSAKQLLGDKVALTLVREVVDTLYHRTIADSIGPISASYSTELSAGRAIVDELEAQRIALPDGPKTPFEVTVTREPREQVRSMISGHDVAAFADILRARETQDWRDSILALERADSSDDQAKCMERHSKLMAKALVGVAEVAHGRDTGIGLRWTYPELLVAGAGGVVTIAGMLSPLWTPIGAVIALSPVTQRWYEHDERMHSTRQALGEMVRPSLS